MAHGNALSFNTRKALTVHLNESAGKEIADLLERLVAQVESLEQRKVDVIPVVNTGEKRKYEPPRSSRAA